MADDLYVLMDGRAASDPDDATVLITGTAKECCDAANEGDYGEGCMVCNLQSEVMWKWFSTGTWIPD